MCYCGAMRSDDELRQLLELGREGAAIVAAELAPASILDDHALLERLCEVPYGGDSAPLAPDLVTPLPWADAARTVRGRRGN